MEFWALPPEINSGRLYTGPGSTPLLEASAAWYALSTGLYSAAAEFGSVVTTLAGTWLGPSSMMMQASAQRYISWLITTAGQAQTTGALAKAAAAAFETARATTIHPAIIATNRTQLAVAVATNVFGQNTGLIAQLEAVYSEFWAQDVAAMATYQAQVAAISLPTFNPLNELTQVVDEFMGGQTPAEWIGSTFQSLLQSGFLGAPSIASSLPVSLLTMFNVLWAVGSPDSAMSQAISNRISNRITVPSISAPEMPRYPVSAALGAGTRIGALSAPREWWAQPPLTAPPPVPAVRRLDVIENDVPVPLATPLPLGAGTPMKQERPQPEYGTTSVQFIPRTPAGG